MLCSSFIPMKINEDHNEIISSNRTPNLLEKILRLLGKHLPQRTRAKKSTRYLEPIHIVSYLEIINTVS